MANSVIDAIREKLRPLGKELNSDRVDSVLASVKSARDIPIELLVQLQKFIDDLDLLISEINNIKSDLNEIENRLNNDELDIDLIQTALSEHRDEIVLLKQRVNALEITLRDVGLGLSADISILNLSYQMIEESGAYKNIITTGENLSYSVPAVSGNIFSEDLGFVQSGELIFINNSCRNLEIEADIFIQSGSDIKEYVITKRIVNRGDNNNLAGQVFLCNVAQGDELKQQSMIQVRVI